MNTITRMTSQSKHELRIIDDQNNIVDDKKRRHDKKNEVVIGM